MRAVLGRLNGYPDGSVRVLCAGASPSTGREAENIVVGNGSNELLRLIAQAVLRPGDECVFAWPSFVVYPMVTQLIGATAVQVPLTEPTSTTSTPCSQPSPTTTRLLFLCNPNNPTGTIYTRTPSTRSSTRSRLTFSSWSTKRTSST